MLFLGNITVTAVWKTLADRTCEPSIIAYAQRLVTVTDWIFTLGGIILAAAGLDPLGPAWLIWGQSLFIASAVIWVLFLVPTQIAQVRTARAFAQRGPIPESYWRHTATLGQPLFHGLQTVSLERRLGHGRCDLGLGCAKTRLKQAEVERRFSNRSVSSRTILPNGLGLFRSASVNDLASLNNGEGLGFVTALANERRVLEAVDMNHLMRL